MRDHTSSLSAALVACSIATVSATPLHCDAGVSGLPHDIAFELCASDLGIDLVRTANPSIDMNGDGIGEILVTASSGSGPVNDLVLVVSGATGEVLDMFNASSASIAGDFNGDGVLDWRISDQGVAIVSGLDGAELVSGSIFAPDGVPMAPSSGYFMPIPDVRGDGLPDLVVGRPGVQSFGDAYIASGVDGTIIQCVLDSLDCPAQYTPMPPQASPSFVVSNGAFRPAGDLNSDGVPDVLLVFAPGNTGDNRHFTQGISGADGSVIFEIVNEIMPGDMLRETPRTGFDFNSDGHDDVLIVDSEGLGLAVAYSGDDASELWRIEGEFIANALLQLGSESLVLPDMTGDGSPDVILSTPNDATGGSQRGSLRFYNGADGQEFARINGEQNIDRLFVTGTTNPVLPDLNDLDGDGIPDFAVFSTDHTLTTNFCLRVYLSAGVANDCTGDCNNSGSVDFGDLVAMLFEFGNAAPGCDANESGSVDFADLVAALFLFGPCP